VREGAEDGRTFQNFGRKRGDTQKKTQRRLRSPSALTGAPSLPLPRHTEGAPLPTPSLLLECECGIRYCQNGIERGIESTFCSSPLRFAFAVRLLYGPSPMFWNRPTSINASRRDVANATHMLFYSQDIFTARYRVLNGRYVLSFWCIFCRQRIQTGSDTNVYATDVFPFLCSIL